MGFKEQYEKFSNAHQKAEQASREIQEFFDEFDLDYSITYFSNDGVAILDNDSTTAASISWKDVEKISRCKTREQVKSVLDGLEYSF